jgi:hypothetical protein
MSIRSAAIVAAAILIGACATVPFSDRDDRVIELIDLFNTAPPADFVAQSGVPFLLNDQVLYAESDLVAVFSRLRGSGLLIAPRIVSRQDAVTAPGDARFDVRVFYDHLPADARAVVVPSNAGDVTLIVAGEANRLPILLGLVRSRL